MSATVASPDRPNQAPPRTPALAALHQRVLHLETVLHHQLVAHSIVGRRGPRFLLKLKFEPICGNRKSGACGSGAVRRCGPPHSAGCAA